MTPPSPFDGDPALLVVSIVGIVAFWWAWVVYAAWHWLRRAEMNTVDIWVRGSIGLTLLCVAYGLTAFVYGGDPSYRIPPLVVGGMGLSVGMTRLLWRDVREIRRRHQRTAQHTEEKRP